MSNRMKIISAITALIIIIGAFGFFIFGNKKPQTQQTTQTQTQSPTIAIANNMSLKDIMSVTSSQKCSFSDDNGNSGTVYSSNGKLKGDFESQINNKSTFSHLLSDGTDFYMWMDGEKKGFKGSIDSMTQMSQQSSTQTSQTVNPDQKVNYKCDSWSEDKTLFNVPTDIKFTDMSSMIRDIPSGAVQQGSENGSDMKATQCKSCENLEGEAQAQCKKVLSC